MEGKLDLNGIEEINFLDMKNLNDFYIKKLKLIHGKSASICNLNPAEANSYLNDLAFILKITLTNLHSITFSLNDFDLERSSDTMLINILRITRDIEANYRENISKIIEENKKTQDKKIEIVKS